MHGGNLRRGAVKGEQACCFRLAEQLGPAERRLDPRAGEPIEPARPAERAERGPLVPLPLHHRRQLELGAPALNDTIWQYGGGTRDGIIAQVTLPRQGVMPAWQGRIRDDWIKMVTIYVHNLGGGQ